MIVSIYSRFRFEDLLLWGRYAALGGCLFVVLFFTCASPKVADIKNRARGKRTELDTSRILTGPLALKENKRSALALSMESRLLLLAQSARPDLEKRDRSFCIGLRGSDVQCVVREGESIPVSLTRHESGGVAEVAFSEEGNAVLIPHLLDGRSLMLKVEGEGFEDQVFLQAGSSDGIFSGIDERVGALRYARWWGRDTFFQKYGGEEFGKLGLKEQLELVTKENSYFLHVGAGDFLTFREGRWRVIDSLDEARMEDPLAQIHRASGDALEIEAWDEEGFVLFYSKLKRERAEPSCVAANEVILEPKLRSAQRVSCKLGKKHCLLRPGDWLIKKQQVWHKLKTRDEIESFLRHDLSGELFVVDSIDEKGMIGLQFFDRTRMQTRPAQLRAASSKAKTKRTR